METSIQERYLLNSKVSVHITAMIGSGLLGYVDSTRSIIRNREIAWGTPLPFSEYIGKTYPAVVVGFNSSYEELELSLRLAERDPWEQVPARFITGTVVEGRVMGLIERAAFLEIVEGVEGYLSADEIPSCPSGNGNLLWIDDRVKTTIIGIDTVRRRLILSLNKLLEQRAQEHQREKWKAKLPADSSQVSLGALLPSSTRRQLLEIVHPTSAPPPFHYRALIVEDDAVYSTGLQDLLRLNGCEVIWVQDAAAGLEQVRMQNPPFDLILIGWGLQGAKGDELVEQLQAQRCPSRLLVVLEPNSLATRTEVWAVLRDSGVDVLPKSDSEVCTMGILAILRELGMPKASTEQSRPPFLPLTIAPLKTSPDWGTEPRVPIPAKKQKSRLEGALRRLKYSTQSATVALLRLASGKSTIEIEECVGKPFFPKEVPPDLIHSPLADILQKGSEICERVGPDSVYFKRLLAISPFQWFLGIPLPMFESHHYGIALFKEYGDFSQQDRRRAREMAYLIANLVQERHVVQSFQSWQAQNLMGQMLGSVVHEVTNKLRGIEFETKFLQRKLDELSRQPERAEDFTFLSDLGRAVQTIGQAQQEADHLRERYLGLTASDVPQSVDLNGLIAEMLGLLRTEARYNDVTLVHQTSENPVRVRAKPSELRQIIVNLVLNAIQQMALWKKQGKVMVAVSVSRESSEIVQVRCIDEGPGIHTQLRERIFDFGFTSKKGGAGIGLTISRQIAASLGGMLRVEQSHMLWGTKFLLELPKGE